MRDRHAHPFGLGVPPTTQRSIDYSVPDLVLQYHAEWRELEQLTALARRSLRTMTPEQVSRLDVLYRRATVHLSRAATRGRDPALIQYLNALTAEAHSLIYVAPRRSIFSGIVRFVSSGFARSVARHAKWHLVSAVIFFGAAVFGYLVSQNDIRAAYALSTPADVRQPGSSPEQLLSMLRHGRDQGHGELFAFASFLFQNNFKVALLAMGTGALAGIPTVLVLLMNGLMLGQFAHMHSVSPELRLEMWAWILPHGIPELGAIVLSGGAGLLLGASLLNPGKLSRGESLRRAGIDAARTALGVGLMLFAAAIIESYVRQSHLGTSARLWFAAVSGGLWGLYFLNGLRLERRDNRSVSLLDGEAALPVTADSRQPDR